MTKLALLLAGNGEVKLYAPGWGGVVPWVSDLLLGQQCLQQSTLPPFLKEVGKGRPVILVLEGRLSMGRQAAALARPGWGWSKPAVQRGLRGAPGPPLTSAIWISSGSSRGWLGPLAKLRFWWAGHMFGRRWLCICFLCFLHRRRVC